MKKTSTDKSNEFYERLAPLYRLKVDWDKRLPKEIALFDLLFADPDVSAVCDLGCGDGGHAEEVVKRGAVYLGIDSSAKMIAMARRTYQGRKGIRFLKGDILHLARQHNGMFDLVLLLGNTLPHILSKTDLKTFTNGVDRLLSAHGRFVVQTVNPALLANKQIHFLAPKLAEEHVLFTPFYVRQGDLWSFQMPIYIIEQGKIISRQVAETKLRFWNRTEIAKATADHFRIVSTYGDAGLSPYSASKSDNLILVMEKT